MNVHRIIDTVDQMKRRSNENHAATELHPEARQAEPTRGEILDAVEKLNSAVEKHRDRVSFYYHEKTNRVILKVIDQQTEEVVREIPPKGAIKLLENIQDYLGILFDESR